MADQTVSLKLEGDASDLQQALNESGQAMDDLSGQAESAASDIESSVSGASSAWDEHSGKINAAAAAMGIAGASLEGFARSQQDATVDLARTSTVTGILSDDLRTLAADTANVTFSTEDVIGTFHTLGRQGVRTEEDLQRVAGVWDLVADATGENVVALAESSVALRTLGVDAHEPEQALDALGFITTETTGSVQEFLTFVERTGPELRDLGLDVDSTAALLGILEQDFGMTGRVARQEFRQAVNDADGSLEEMLDTLGITPERFNEMAGSVDGSAQALHANAEALEESFTPLQRLSAELETTMLRYGGLADAAGMISPVLMGAGGAVFAVNQARQAFRWMAGFAGSANTAVRNLGRFMLSPLGIATAAGAIAIGRISTSISGLRDEARLATDELVETFGQGINTTTMEGQVERMRAQMDGLRDTQGDLGDTLSTTRRGYEVVVEALPFVDSALLENEAAIHATTEEYNDLQEALRNVDDRVVDVYTVLADTHGIQLSREEILGLADSLGIDLTTAADDVVPKLVDAALASEEGADAARDHADAVDGQADAQDEAASAADRHREALEELVSEQRAATDPVFALERAMSRYDEVSNDAEATSWDVARAISDVERAALDGDLSFDAFEGKLREWVRQGRITEDQADDIRDSVSEMRGEAEDWRGNYEAVVSVDDQASGPLGSIRGQLDRLPTSFNIRASVSGMSASELEAIGVRAEGGPVWPGGSFLVGEEGPELVTFSQHGQVHSAPDTARILGGDGASVQATINVRMDGRLVGSAPVVIDSMTGAVKSRQRDMGMV